MQQEWGDGVSIRNRKGAHHIKRFAIALAAIATMMGGAQADEGGVSFWVPGFFGSLAAAPQTPGWSLATIYYHTSISAGADVALAKEFELRRAPANLTANANLNLKVSGTADLGFVIPTYVFATPVLGGQASASLAGAYGVVSSSLAVPCQARLQSPHSLAVHSCSPIPSTIPLGALRIWCRNSLCVGTPASTTS